MDRHSKGGSRRAFLKGGGGRGAGDAVSRIPRSAACPGQTATPPRRFIVLKSFSTQLVQEWYPRFTGNGYVLKDSKYPGTTKADGTTLFTQKLVSRQHYSWAPLTDFRRQRHLRHLGPALNPYLSKLTLIRGLDFLPAVNHNYGGLLGNFSSCTAATPCDADGAPRRRHDRSGDGVLHEGLAATPGLRSLHLSQGVTNAMSYSNLGIQGGPIQQLKARTNPLDAFNDVFGGLSGGTAMPPPLRDRLLVDRVYTDYTRLRHELAPVRRGQTAASIVT